MCFKCEGKCNKDHRCRSGKVFMIIDSSDSDNDVISNEEATSDEGELKVAELGENNCEAELSINAMSRVSKPSTMRLMAWVGKFEVSMLVDSDSSHNFINLNFVRKIGLRRTAIEPGLVGVDVVLGNAWLKSIGKVVTDFDAMTMEFKLGRRKRTWDALPLKEIKQCEAQMIERLCKRGAQCFAVRLSEKVRKVVANHRQVLEVPTSLPSPHHCDHRITLKDEAKPVNVPLYRYAHFQKYEIERQVEEMLKNGLIRHSQSPF
ncbi:hypothetical protein EZV62_008602 [Acer yangbiense]|uniref:Uncharacterized protein n=1 Tax=Acer yangbiense TaxID=1000413 RepID=A0A5C7IDG4_9ROSI|nr:hypothetical protein EZV62_008602 [Acer yangbiense]